MSRFKELLGEELKAANLIELAIHGARPEFVSEILALELPGLGVEDLIEMKIHGMRAEEARRAKEVLGDNLTAQKLIEMAIHGLLPE
jgi:hypothetical protein